MEITAKLVKELREKSGAGMLDCKKALVENKGDIKESIAWLREKGITKAAKKSDRIAAEGLCNIVTKGDTAIVYELNSETDFVAKNDKFLKLLDLVGKVLLDNDCKDAESALKAKEGSKTLEEILTENIAIIGEKITLRKVFNIKKDKNQTFGTYKHMGGTIVSLTVAEGKDDVAQNVAMHVCGINPKFLDENSIDPAVLEAERKALIAEIKNDPKMAKKPDKVIEENILPGRMNKYKKAICLVDQPYVADPDVTVEKYCHENKTKIVSFLRLEVGEGIEKKADDFAAEVMSQVKV